MFDEGIIKTFLQLEFYFFCSVFSVFTSLWSNLCFGEHADENQEFCDGFYDKNEFRFALLLLNQLEHTVIALTCFNNDFGFWTNWFEKVCGKCVNKFHKKK